MFFRLSVALMLMKTRISIYYGVDYKIARKKGKPLMLKAGRGRQGKAGRVGRVGRVRTERGRVKEERVDLRKGGWEG